MPKKGGVPENLVNFKKGYDERRNANGNTGGTRLVTILNRLLNSVTTIEDEGVSEQVTKKEAIAIGLIKAAIAGQSDDVKIRAAKAIFEHTDPTPKQLQISDPDGSPLNFGALTTEDKRTMLSMIDKAMKSPE